MLAAQNQGGSKKVILILIRFIIRIMSNQTRPELWQVVVDECIHHTKFWKVTWCILSGSGIIFVVKLTLFYIFKVSKSEPCSPKYSKIVIAKNRNQQVTLSKTSESAKKTKIDAPLCMTSYLTEKSVTYQSSHPCENARLLWCKNISG